MLNRYQGICHCCGVRVAPGGGSIDRDADRPDHYRVTCGGCTMRHAASAMILDDRRRRDQEGAKT